MDHLLCKLEVLSTDVCPKQVPPFLVDQIEALQVILGPAGLGLDHGSQRLDGERVTPGVRCYGNTAAIGMLYTAGAIRSAV
jgi:hypothetical protein